MDAILQMLIGLLGPKAAMIMALLGTLLVVCDVIIAWTPGKVDDEKWAGLKRLPVVLSIVEALQKLTLLVKKPQDPQA